MPDLSHLNTLELHLSNERMRVASATNKAEIALREIWIAQLEKEIAGERAFLCMPEQPMPDIDEDELLRQLNQ